MYFPFAAFFVNVSFAVFPDFIVTNFLFFALAFFAFTVNLVPAFEVILMTVFLPCLNEAKSDGYLLAIF